MENETRGITWTIEIYAHPLHQKRRTKNGTHHKCNSTNYLEVIFDNKLKYKAHLNQVVNQSTELITLFITRWFQKVLEMTSEGRVAQDRQKLTILLVKMFLFFHSSFTIFIFVTEETKKWWSSRRNRVEVKGNNHAVWIWRFAQLPKNS